MLSRVMNRNLAKGLQLSKMVKPGQYTCFCGCVDGKHSNVMGSMPRRHFQGHLGLDSGDLLPTEYKTEDQVSLWKEIKNKQENSLVLKTGDEIE